MLTVMTAFRYEILQKNFFFVEFDEYYKMGENCSRYNFEERK